MLNTCHEFKLTFLDGILLLDGRILRRYSLARALLGLRICDVVAVAVTTIACDGSHANLHASVCAYTQIVAKIVLGRRLHNDRRLRKAMASLEAPGPLAIEEPNSKPHLSFRNLLQRSQHCHLDDEAFKFESKTSKTAAL